MLNKLDIIYMGNSEFAIAPLMELLNGKFNCKLNVKAIVTSPDTISSKKHNKITESPVKTYVKTLGIPILQPNNLNDDNFINELKNYNADLFIVVAFKILPKNIWSIPRFGTINVHASLLPNYRGAAPIHWAIINGEKTTGVTTFYIDEHIDTGNIISNIHYNINENSTVDIVYNDLMECSKTVINDTINIIIKNDGEKTHSIKQDEVIINGYAPKLTKENTKIKWDNTVDNVYNFIRGLNSYPGAWGNIINGNNIIEAKIYDVIKTNINCQQYVPGSIINYKKGCYIACKDFFIKVLTMQLPGKKIIDGHSVLNGLRLSPINF